MAKDFAFVRLTAAGEKLAEGHPLRYSNGRRSIVFADGKPPRVERSYELTLLLGQHTHDGIPLFELVPEDEEPQLVPAS